MSHDNPGIEIFPSGQLGITNVDVDDLAIGGHVAMRGVDGTADGVVMVIGDDVDVYCEYVGDGVDGFSVVVLIFGKLKMGVADKRGLVTLNIGISEGIG